MAEDVEIVAGAPSGEREPDDGGALREQRVGVGDAPNDQTSSLKGDADARAGSSGSASRMALKDWLSLTLSVLALLVSSGTAYFNLLRVTDDLAFVSAENAPKVDFNFDSGDVEVDADYAITVFNAGTRPAALTELRVTARDVTRHPTSSDPAVICSGSGGVKTELEPLIIEAGAVVRVPIKVEGEKGELDLIPDNEAWDGREREAGVRESVDSVSVGFCYLFEVTTSVRSQTVSIPIFTVEFTRERGSRDYATGHLQFGQRVPIISAWGTIFD